MSIVENWTTHNTSLCYEPNGVQGNGFLNGINDTDQEACEVVVMPENMSEGGIKTHKKPIVNRSLSFGGGSAKKSKKLYKRRGSLKKAAKRIEDLDRSLSISLEELLQGVNATKSPQSAERSDSLDFSSPHMTPACSTNLETEEDPDDVNCHGSPILNHNNANIPAVAMVINPNINTPQDSTSVSVSSTKNIHDNPEITVTAEILNDDATQGLTVTDDIAFTNNKHSVPPGDLSTGLYVAESYNFNPKNISNDLKNVSKNAPKPPNFLNVTTHSATETDSDLSPTSLEVNNILQYVTEQVTELEQTPYDSRAISTQSEDSTVAAEYCRELSTLTLDTPSDDLEIREDKEDGKLKLSRPRCAKEVQRDVLHSGVVTFPGCHDKNRRPVLFIHCDSMDGTKIGKIGIARLMLYLVSSSSYITLVVHLRDKAHWDVVSQCVMLFQTNCPGVISKIIVVTENTELHPNIDEFQAEHNIVYSSEDLVDFISINDIPESLGGNLKYNHRAWVTQRLDVESYALLCERLQHNFASHTVAMTAAILPTTLDDTNDVLNKHRSTMTALLDDPKVRDLHDTGHRFLTQLNRVDKAENQTYSEKIQASYESVCSAIQRYVQAADERLLALEKHLLVKQFEESCDRILSWASDRRDELQSKFGEVADSLNELRIQRQEFDRFYLEVVKQYAQCDCLLSEANQLSSSGFLGQVNSQARNAAEKISQVVQDMEMKKEEVETASQLYLFVDQAYSWALAGMKFVASLSMSETMSTEQLQQQIDKYDEYMTGHPPIPNDEFIRMQQIAANFNNIKCQRQCEVAQQKCMETKELFVKRRKLLVKARDQQLKEARRKEGKISPEAKSDQEMICENNNNNNKNEESVDKPQEKVKKTRALLRQSSDVSHRLNRPNGFNNNGGIATVKGLNESAISPGSVKHRPKKMLKKSASMSGQHMRLKIGSPMRGEEPDTQGRSKWSLAIEELITTEEEYVKSLNYIIEHYYPLMNQIDDVPQALRGKRGVIFGNIENICDFHAGQFLEALKECYDQPWRVADVFMQHRESFGMYALYSKNKPRSDELMREHGTKFFRSKQHSLRDKMDLASYLLKPVQRMGKYALLLHNIGKHSEPKYRSVLKEAESLVKFQLRHGNDLLAMDSIVDCDVNLKEQGELLRQDEFLIFHGRRKYLRHIFLFDDLILLSKPQKVHGGHDVYHYKLSHKTAEIGLTENIGDTGLKFEIWFRRPMQDNIILYSSNEQKKQAWVDDIRGILWKQALKNKANRRNEMANMGVGSKPHLEIRASESPITDRSVATEKLMGGRVLSSRSRASIAVSTFEHACKRPHSTVSTSSTSSNGSFQLAPHQPASMFDFRAILEGEEYESGSGHGSSICMSSGEPEVQEENTEEVSEASNDSLPQQYITTV